MRASARRTQLQFFFFFFFFFVFNTLHIFSFYHNPFFFILFFVFFIFSLTVSIRIFINEMMLSCYLSMLVILNLLNRFATFRM